MTKGLRVLVTSFSTWSGRAKLGALGIATALHTVVMWTGPITAIALACSPFGALLPRLLALVTTRLEVRLLFALATMIGTLAILWMHTPQNVHVHVYHPLSRGLLGTDYGHSLIVTVMAL